MGLPRHHHLFEHNFHATKGSAAQALPFLKEKMSLQETGTYSPVIKPEHEMPEREHHPRQAFAMVREELMLGGDSRRDLAPPVKPFPTYWDC